MYFCTWSYKFYSNHSSLSNLLSVSTYLLSAFYNSIDSYSKRDRVGNASIASCSTFEQLYVGSWYHFASITIFYIFPLSASFHDISRINHRSTFYRANSIVSSAYHIFNINFFQSLWTCLPHPDMPHLWFFCSTYWINVVINL